MKNPINFTQGFLEIQTAEAKKKNKPIMVFDWDKAAQIIKEKYETFKDLTAEAGLKNGWYYTSGVIFEHEYATIEEYAYLQANWATPILILHYGGESIEIECWVEENERSSKTTAWDEISLNILGRGLYSS